MPVRIPLAVLDAIRREAVLAAPHEACGLLFGSDSAISSYQAVENVDEAPDRHFEIDPAALFAALRAERGGGPKLQGYWHSHPGGDATPSVTDAAMAAPDGKLWLIVGGATVTAWRAVERGELHGRFDPVTIA
ncbi:MULTISPECIES: M67 family metallopeptidase [Sphingomonas]|uniref:M67 family metallopeptidase n=1 Tax=Sphingomonas TaxID=13687 RepID=UPI00095B9BBF|nr:M67 family metallopeptidase [Sphingomonas sp. 67-41]MBN8811537.1 M67 family metallopeptidase [Sphingomonas sp.]OJY49790.1 MAG: peptidase [Sphingomonas sp. 67-41]